MHRVSLNYMSTKIINMYVNWRYNYPKWRFLHCSWLILSRTNDSKRSSEYKERQQRIHFQWNLNSVLQQPFKTYQIMLGEWKEIMLYILECDVTDPFFCNHIIRTNLFSVSNWIAWKSTKWKGIFHWDNKERTQYLFVTSLRPRREATWIRIEFKYFHFKRNHICSPFIVVFYYSTKMPF